MHPYTSPSLFARTHAIEVCSAVELYQVLFSQLSTTDPHSHPSPDFHQSSAPTDLQVPLALVV